MPKTGQDMDTLSLWDRLNTSRHRRTNHRALDELHHTLSSLEQRLLEFQQRSNRMTGDSSKQASASHYSSPESRKRENEEALAEIAHRLHQLTGQTVDPDDTQYQSPNRKSRTQRLGSSEIESDRGFEHKSRDAALTEERRAQRLANVDFLDLLEKLDGLSDRVDVIAHQLKQPDSALTTLIGQLDHLAQVAVRFIEDAERLDVNDFHARLAQIEIKLTRIEDENRVRTEQILAEFDKKFLSLAERLDAQASGQSNQDAIVALETKFGAFAQKLNQDIEQVVQHHSAQFAHSDAFRSLNQQIGHITQLLDQPNADIQSLKPRLEAIENALRSTSELTVNVAREAAQAATERLLLDGAERHSAIEEKLGNELRSLEELSQVISKQHSENLFAVQQVLSEVNNRLQLLEQSAAHEQQTHNVASEQTARPTQSSISNVEVATEANASQQTKDRNVAAIDPQDQQSNLFPQDDEKLPDLHSIVKRVRAQTLDRGVEASDPQKSTKPDVVTIARRSVMRSSIEVEASDVSSRKHSDDEPPKSPDPTHKKRKSILFGFGAALAALAGLQISTALKLNHREDAVVTTKTESEMTERLDHENVDRTNIVGSIKRESDQDTTSTSATAEKERTQKAIGVMQQLLQADGYNMNAINGLMDEQTRSAIQKFRANNGLDSSELIDEKLVKLLLEKANQHSITESR